MKNIPASQLCNFRLTFITSCLFLFSITAAGCNEQNSSASDQVTQINVGIITVTPQKIIKTTELPGRTAAVLTSEVRPQVNGVIQKRLFVEGSEVKEGQQLYQIDPAPYKAAYDTAIAALNKSNAALATSQAKAVRYKKLIESETVSRQDYDDVVATARQAQADIESAKANVEQARINLGYTKMFSPISGRIGHSTVTPGALVTQNQTAALATITQLDPIYVDLNQSVTTLLRLRKEMEANRKENTSVKEATVVLKMEDESTYPYIGTLKFSEVTVDQGTGTVLLRASFPNPKHMLLPGMYVHAIIQEGINQNGIMIPQKSVTRNAHGEATVRIVQNDNNIALRTIQIGAAQGDQWIVNGGLEPGDRVVVDNIQNARPGTAVHPVAAAEPEGSASVAIPAKSNS